MKILYPKNENGQWTQCEEIEGESIFLAGPCPRYDYDNDWREYAIRVLKRACFEGTVIVPTNDKYDETNPTELETQTTWEHDMMYLCDVIFFNLDKSDEHPGFTTNFECGEWFYNKNKYKKVFVYCPKDNTARANRYILIKAEERNIPVCNTTLEDALITVRKEFIYKTERRLDLYNSSFKLLTEKIDETYKHIFNCELITECDSNIGWCLRALEEIKNNYKKKCWF